MSKGVFNRQQGRKQLKLLYCMHLQLELVASCHLTGSYKQEAEREWGCLHLASLQDCWLLSIAPCSISSCVQFKA